MVTWEGLDLDTAHIDDGILILKCNPGLLKQAFDSTNQVYGEINTRASNYCKYAVLEIRVLITKREPDHEPKHELSDA